MKLAGSPQQDPSPRCGRCGLVIRERLVVADPGSSRGPGTRMDLGARGHFLRSKLCTVTLERLEEHYNRPQES